MLFITRLVCACALAASAFGADAAKPNIILILSDDQGFPDYGFMGHKVVKTPNLDRMAEQSLLYTRGYVMPVCSPSLACLLTGKLPHEHGITGNDLAGSAKPEGADKKSRDPLAHRLLSNSLILPKVLGDAGYVSFQSGKLWNVTYADVGFTEGMTDKASRHGDDGLTIGRKGMKPVFDFMDKARSANKPFFVWYAPMMPHTPHNPPVELLAHYTGKGLTRDAEKYYAMVEWFDQTCGELDDYLSKNNLADNTVVIYLADNGWVAEKANGPRGKLSPFELGIRTPMFVRWPKTVKPQRDDVNLASIVDIVPTMLSAAQIAKPTDLPGIDLLDVQAITARKTIFVEGYTHDINNLSDPSKSLVTRVVINEWTKLLVPSGLKPDQSYTTAPTAVQLFDLKADPLEKVDLAAQRPDDVKRLMGLQDAEWNAKP